MTTQRTLLSQPCWVCSVRVSGTRHIQEHTHTTHTFFIAVARHTHPNTCWGQLLAACTSSVQPHPAQCCMCLAVSTAAQSGASQVGISRRTIADFLLRTADQAAFLHQNAPRSPQQCNDSTLLAVQDSRKHAVLRLQVQSLLHAQSWHLKVHNTLSALESRAAATLHTRHSIPLTTRASQRDNNSSPATPAHA